MLLCIVAFSCNKKSVKLKADSVVDRALMPALEATDVTTLISDSGIIRYKIKTPKWFVYDKADTPHWEFPKGVYLEKFNLDLEADAFVEADYAYYNEKLQRWTLRGNDKALNLEGEQFETPLLFWDQKGKKVYSDSSIVIIRETSIIQGVGFTSNETMTEYTILNPTGVFPIDEEEEEEDEKTVAEQAEEELIVDEK
jgi:LPS export ABC transporter protein LptC